MTELEKILEDIVDSAVLQAYGSEELAKRLRKTIADEIDVDAMVNKYTNDIASMIGSDDYRQGVEDTLKAIKGE